MGFLQRIREKQTDNKGTATVSAVFLGDSVTQGCFELTPKGEKDYAVAFRKQDSYCEDFGKLLGLLYPSVPVNIINSGISGDNAEGGLERLERDVLRFHPDLVVVCFGLNDSSKGMEAIDAYAESLRGIFAKLQEMDAEVIFMTPNMMNTTISDHTREPLLVEICTFTMNKQNSGAMDCYMDAARQVCREMRVPVCDCYAIWKKLYYSGVNVTDLLANHANHPTKEMHWLFAIELLRTLMA